MLIYHAETTLDEGFEVCEQLKENRLVRGRKVSRPSGYALFSALREGGQPLKCWACGAEATCFVVNKGRNDKLGSPTLDLFGTNAAGQLVLLTRDHIIPKSVGGSDTVANLRVGCSPCNGARGNLMTREEVEFMRAHPELVTREPTSPVLLVEDAKPKVKKPKKRRRRKSRGGALTTLYPLMLA